MAEKKNETGASTAKPSEKIEVILNPATELAAYTFEDGAGFNSGTKYSLTSEQYAKYGEKTRSGKKLLIRA